MADNVKSGLAVIPPSGDLTEFSGLSGPETQLAVVRRIDEYQQEIAQIHQRILELKSIHNAVTPFHRLPSELLIHIFRLIDPNSRHHIRLSHVCRLWRSAIHQAPEFWVGILSTVPVIDHPHGLHLFETFVERTARLPFGLSIGSGNLTVIQQLPNRHRLRLTLLSITFSHDYRADLLDLIDMELPNVQHLKFPHLRILNTHGICLTPALIVPSLRDLRIFGPGVVSRTLILKVLRGCPCLEMLTIENVHRDPAVIIDPGPPIPMKRLKRLTLHFVPGESFSGLFLSRLKYPPTTEIDIIGQGRLLSDYLCHRSPLLTPTPATSTIQSLEINLTPKPLPDFSVCEITGASDASPNRFSMTLWDAPWEGGFHDRNGHIPLLSGLPWIFSSSHPGALTDVSLCFHGGLSASEGNWDVILRAFPQIQHFTVRITSCGGLLHVLQKYRLLPQLLTLSITCENETGADESLVLAIESRAVMGLSRLDELRFYTQPVARLKEVDDFPPFSTVRLERLKAYVRDVYTGTKHDAP
ncbi:hypothetical protein LXA43DRAFT_1018099 [Ganoderma leucocontextum]|nr:hypothetical protein LXA43DRAFT_1018099 [Ganoderma leucocontextum]